MPESKTKKRLSKADMVALQNAKPDTPPHECGKKSARKKTPREITLTQEGMVEYLKANLKLEIAAGGFTDPNNRQVRLWLGEDLLSETSFDVVQQREYEG